MMDVDTAIHQAVHEYREAGRAGAVAIAPHIGLSAKTVLNMADPRQPQSTWSLFRFRKLLTVDKRPLHALCAENGGVFVETAPGAITDDQIGEILARFGSEFGDVCGAVRTSLADGRVNEKEARNFALQVYELNQVAHELQARIASKVPRRPALRAMETANA